MFGNTPNALLDRRPASPLGEADIDLLIVEELHVSVEFRTWFISRIVGHEVGVGEFIGAWRSVATNLGESDIVVLCKAATSGHIVALLIEDKIRAEFQERQPERYSERGLEGQQAGWWDKFVTVLIAPSQYQATADERFDCRVSYEAIRGWFDERSTEPRYAFKAAVLSTALDPAARIWQRVTDEVTTAFFQKYEELCLRDFPSLALKPKPQRSAKDYWIFFHRAVGLLKGVYIIHKCDRGFVDLTFPNLTKEQLVAASMGILDSRMTVVQTGKSAAVRLRVPLLKHKDPFEQQVEDVIEGLKAADVVRVLAAPLMERLEVNR